MRWTKFNKRGVAPIMLLKAIKYIWATYYSKLAVWPLKSCEQIPKSFYVSVENLCLKQLRPQAHTVIRALKQMC